MNERPDWDEYFLAFAQLASTRASCPRAYVGAAVVLNKRIIATGYNGAASGEPDCFEVGCEIVEDHCIRAQHAETNALAQCARFGQRCEGGTIYVYDNIQHTDRQEGVCSSCKNLIKAAGIDLVICRIHDQVQTFHMKKGVAHLGIELGYQFN